MCRLDGWDFLGLTSVSPADQRRSMSVKESGDARTTWRDMVVVRKKGLMREVVVGRCMVAVVF
jgi:hypothetical protein